jgi:signal recognition particle receptor subunit alpha
MLDWFSIFTKGGIVLWYFQGQALSHTPAVNSLIRSVILQVSWERWRKFVLA